MAHQIRADAVFIHVKPGLGTPMSREVDDHQITRARMERQPSTQIRANVLIGSVGIAQQLDMIVLKTAMSLQRLLEIAGIIGGIGEIWASKLILADAD